MAELGYPRTTGGRQLLRDTYRRRIVERAEREAAMVGLSIKCRGEGMAVQHATAPGGCANNGSGCLCECHDEVVRDGD